MNSVWQLVERAAARVPERIAAADREHSYTYAALLQAARRLASLLPYDARKPIGVFAGRDAETVVRFLAVICSGNFYVPLDPDMPAARLRAIVEDAAPPVLLGRPEDRCRLEELGYSGGFLTMDDAGDAVCTPCPCSGDDPLYMVYTSGSTGKPKGVLKSHGAMLSFLEAFSSRFPLDEGEVLGNQTPFFFDASAKDLYLSLWAGGTLEILPSELFSFPPMLIRYLNERRVTWICWVPSALCIVTQLGTFREVLPETLRSVFFVGEVFPVKQLQKWRDALPEARFVNLFGSSEIAGVCCCYPVTGSLEGVTVLPMGKPLPNCRVSLWDAASGRPADSPDQVGEVYISSPALALEYYHDPEKTAAAFFTDASGSRVFRTGDLAKYDDAGNLVFVSRKDFQIKHKGRRIELGEIEAAADALPQLRRCCCLYDQEKHRIFLFCELQPDSGWDSAAVRRALKERLSDYMLPERVTVLDRLPLNANGKIDRQTLKQRMGAQLPQA